QPRINKRLKTTIVVGCGTRQQPDEPDNPGDGRSRCRVRRVPVGDATRQPVSAANHRQGRGGGPSSKAQRNAHLAGTSGGMPGRWLDGTTLVSSRCGTAAASDVQTASGVAADGGFFRIPRFARRDAFVAVTVRSPQPG